MPRLALLTALLITALWTAACGADPTPTPTSTPDAYRDSRAARGDGHADTRPHRHAASRDGHPRTADANVGAHRNAAADGHPDAHSPAGAAE